MFYFQDNVPIILSEFVLQHSPDSYIVRLNSRYFYTRRNNDQILQSNIGSTYYYFQECGRYPLTLSVARPKTEPRKRSNHACPIHDLPLLLLLVMIFRGCCCCGCGCGCGCGCFLGVHATAAPRKLLPMQTCPPSVISTALAAVDSPTSAPSTSTTP